MTQSFLILCRTLSGHGGMESAISMLAKHLAEKSVFAGLCIMHFRRPSADATQWFGNIHTYEIESSLPRLVRPYRYLFDLKTIVNKKGVTTVICVDEACVRLAYICRRLFSLNFSIVSWMHFSLTNIKPSRRHWLKYADSALSISSGITRQLVEIGIPESQITTVFNCTTPKQETIPRCAEALQKYVYVGRVQLHNHKNLQELFNALATLPFDWQLHVIGSGETEICKTYAKNIGVDNRIHWHGWQKEPWKFILSEVNTVTALIMTSRSEGFSCVPVEAMSYGVICVLSNCPTGPEDIILSGENGYLYTPGKPKELASVLNFLRDQGVTLDSNGIKQSISHLYINEYMKKIDKALRIE